ncbi:Ig-like domain-containing protein [Dolosigranulum pigrum]|uniref:Ig-like domain-containing protein n=1 Tax=Dolosigranulum pigrum TaxID=29394 RepID=UPI001AD89CD4|nr:Ig-like domain-containing protein [Dolosigranulum pigrum]QTJ47214.1 hypothetical protein FE329_07860 [Dolosigranulum pigrum]QTJ60724.1 hypothetical protein FE337_07885 [Dolosigranulum pigrum]
MKKIMAIVLVMLLWISVPFSSHSQFVYGQEVGQSVQSVSFNLDRPYVDDQVLTGQAMADQELTVYVNNHSYQAVVDSTGHYSVVLNQPVSAGDKIHVQQGMNQFEATVQEENEGLDAKIHFQGLFSLEGLVEEPAESESTEEAEGSDEVAEEPPEEEQEAEEEEDEEDTAEAVEEEETLQPRAPERQHANCPNERNAACVKNGDELKRALQDRKIEKVVVLNNLNNVPNISAVRSNTGTKILEANGYSISMRNNGQITLDDPSIKDFYIQNASNLYSTNSKWGMFNAETIGINIHVKDSNYNVQNSSAAGYFGESWGSQINFYGDVTINANSNYSIVYRSVRVHPGANVNINGNGGIALKSNSSAGPTNNIGVTVDSSARLNISSRSKPGMYFIRDNRGYHLTANSGASLIVHSQSSNAISVERGNSFSFLVGPGANTQLSSSSGGSSVFLLQDIAARINMQEGSRTVFEHRGGGSTFGFGGGSSANFNLNYPELVEFRKTNTGRPIIQGEQNGNAVSINIQNNMEVSRYKANGEMIDKIGPGNYTSRTSGNKWQGKIFDVSTGVNLIQVGSSVTPVIEVNDIYTFQTTITGTATPNSEVTVTGPNNFKRTTTANSEGNFTIDVGNAMPNVGTELSFTASIYGRVSDTVSKTVQQPTVELEVSDMNFGQHEIVDEIIEATPQEDFRIRVERTPAEAPFKVTAKVSPFMAENGIDRLDNVLFFRGNDLQRASQTIMSNQSPTAEAKDFVLKVNPIQQFVMRNQTYTSKITWTLTNGPGE